MKGCSEKNANLSFFLRTTQLLCTPNFILRRPPLHVVCKKSWQIFDKICETKYLFKNFVNFASSRRKIIIFKFKMSKKKISTFQNFENVYFHGKGHSAMHWSPTMGALTLRRKQKEMNTKSLVTKYKFTKYKVSSIDTVEGAKHYRQQRSAHLGRRRHRARRCPRRRRRRCSVPEQLASL